MAGSKTFAAQEVYYTDLKGGSETVSGEGGWIIAESWTSDCHLVSLRRIGSIFISVGLTMLFLGAFLECLARRLRSRRITVGQFRKELNVGDLEADMLENHGLSPPRPCNYDASEEEQSILHNNSFPLKTYSPESSFALSTLSTTSGNRLE